MTGQKLLCSSCFADPSKHSQIVDTVEIKPTDKRYLGMPEQRRCESCNAVVGTMRDPRSVFPEDQGAIQVGCYMKDGQIVVDFGKDLSWFALDRVSARAFINTLNGLLGVHGLKQVGWPLTHSAVVVGKADSLELNFAERVKISLPPGTLQPGTYDTVKIFKTPEIEGIKNATVIVVGGAKQ